MKTIPVFLLFLLWLTTEPIRAQQGLKGEYYTGTNFERKVFSRIDPQLNFDWRGRSPAPGLPQSYYSIRWTGKLLAPASGQYTFSANVDDGIRVWVGNKKVMDSWQLNDSKQFRGSVLLEAGKFYDLRVDYFNDMLEGEIQLFWQRPDKKNLLDQFVNNRDLITADYFFQNPDPRRFTLIKTPPQSVPKPPPVVATILPRVAPKKQPITPPKAAVSPSPAKRVATADTVKASPPPVHQSTAEPLAGLKPGAAFILHHVQFEQSSYTLLPESSAELDQLVTVLKKNSTWRVTIAGHTDNIGDPRLNLALSENRAKIVANYLTRRGIADDRITAKGFGGTQPVADNATEAERAKNRRVEITIL